MPDATLDEIAEDWDGAAVARFIRDKKVIEGQDGFLFMADDNNDVISQHTGALRLDPGHLEGWRRVLERRTEVLAERGCAHLVMIAPNNHSVYPELLPAGIVAAPERPVHQLASHLAEKGSPVELLYPLDALVTGKAQRLVCGPTDSHWSDFGAFIAYSELVAAAAPLVETRIVDVDDLMFMDIAVTGDLGFKYEPPRKAPQPFGRMRYRSARLIYDNNVEGTGSLAVTDCALAPHTTALLLADSYGYPFAKFLAESFRRLVFAHAPTLDMETVAAVRPDIAVTLVAERFLVVVPEDARGRSMAMREQRKRENGRTRPPLQYWTWPMLVSPGPVEVMRERLLGEGRLMETALVSVMAYAGLRPSEAMTLRWSAVEQDAIAVVPGPGNARARPRRMPLWRPLAEDLEAWRRDSGRGGDQLVFVQDGKPIDMRAWRQHTYYGLALAAGLENRRPAFLREVFCVLMINAGVPIDELAELVDMDVAKLEENFKGLWEEIEMNRTRTISPHEAIARARSEFLR